MEWQDTEPESQPGGDHSIFGEPPRRYSIAEAAEASDDELYHTALRECHRVVEENGGISTNPEIALEVDRRTGVGIGIAALAAANVKNAA